MAVNKNVSGIVIGTVILFILTFALGYLTLNEEINLIVGEVTLIIILIVGGASAAFIAQNRIKGSVVIGMATAFVFLTLGLFIFSILSYMVSSYSSRNLAIVTSDKQFIASILPITIVIVILFGGIGGAIGYFIQKYRKRIGSYLSGQ